MKTLKNILIAGSILGLTNVACLAEGNGGGNGFVDAATKYEKLSQKALSDGNLKDAEIYHKLALIKLAAAKASKNGEDFSWDEYHALHGQLSHHKGGKHGKHGKKDKHGKKGGSGFNSAAERYKKLAQKARENGNEADAKIYDRMSQIKIDAAAHRGDKPFDWSEYHKLNGKLSGKGNQHKHKHGKKGKNHKHHKKGKGGNGFLKAAAEYTAKANEAMQNGDEESAEIYTKLAAMKREAAAAAANGKGYDWTEYFKLRKQLKK